MALNIKSDEADSLARALVEETGETITEAVTVALKERLERVKRPKDERRKEELRALVAKMQGYKKIGDTPVDELLGYNKDGFFD
jgi:antitoxin VapB